MSKVIIDKDLGEISLVKRWNARNYVIRLSRGKISVSLPFYGTYSRAMELLEEHRSRLMKKMEESHIRSLTVAEEADLRKRAKQYLPLRLSSLAEIHHFHYSGVSIRKSKTRWGSCSSKKTINLSFYLMLLPEHLADYVLLHELCHTIHMNHGPEFWKLLDSVTGGRAKLLRKELRSFHL